MILGSMFLLSAAFKGTDVTRFSRLIADILDHSSIAILGSISDFTGVIAVFILLMEIVLGAMLICGIRIKLTAILSVLVLFGFTLITLNISKSLAAGDCGCFGILLPRSAKLSVIENVVFMIIAASLTNGTKNRIIPHPNLASVLIAIGVLWMGIFYLFPPSWSALRVGSSWKEITAKPALQTEDSFFIWLMSPECLDCQSKTDLISQMKDKNVKIIALTDVTQGRVMEYIYDWEPRFKLHRVTDKSMKSFGLKLGTLISVNSGRVAEIWDLDEIKINDVMIYKDKGH